MTTCPICDRPFDPKPRQRYCSPECNTVAQNRKNSPLGARGLKHCRMCIRALPFDAFDWRQRLCKECMELRESGRKRCAACATIKPHSEFHPRKNKDGHEPRCKVCSADASRARNASPQQRERKRGQHYMRRHGITAAQFDAMAAAQDGLCAICRRPPNGMGALHIDHDHACCEGEVTCGKCRRGLICNGCNFALGAIEDDPAIAHAMADYLRRYNHEIPLRT